MKAAAVLSVVFMAAASTLAQPNQYPEHTGYVNDFAGVITSSDKAAMANKIADFEKATGIEIAVVAVKTIGEQQPADYVQGLWEVWKVGKAGRNNGVIFLIAVDDRLSRIQVGYGLEPYLTDGQAGQILREVVRPSFRQDPPNYSGGISAGVDELVAKLGPKTYVERVAEQKAAQEQRQREQEESARQAGIFFAWFFTIVGIGTVIGVIWCYFSRKSALKRSIRKIRQQIPALVSGESEVLKRAAAALEALQNSNPPSVWQTLTDELTAFPVAIRELTDEQPVSKEPLPFRNSDLRIIDGIMRRRLKDANRILDLPARIAKRRKEVEACQAESIAALAALPEEMSRLQTLLSLPQLSVKARQAWEQAQAKFGQAKAVSGGYMVDWIAVCNLLREVRKLLDQFLYNAKPAARAWKHSSSDGQSAEGCGLLDAALVGAAVVAVFGDNLEPAPSYSSHSTYETPSYSSSSDTFGGFGGGSSGGGGADMKW